MALSVPSARGTAFRSVVLAYKWKLDDSVFADTSPETGSVTDSEMVSVTKNCLSPHSLNDNTVPTPRTQASTHTIMVAVPRLMPFSTAQATAGSAMEIAELQAAIATRTKKAVPIHAPPGSAPKAIGRAH